MSALVLESHFAFLNQSLVWFLPPLLLLPPAPFSFLITFLQ